MYHISECRANSCRQCWIVTWTASGQIQRTLGLGLLNPAGHHPSGNPTQLVRF